MDGVEGLVEAEFVSSLIWDISGVGQREESAQMSPLHFVVIPVSILTLGEIH